MSQSDLESIDDYVLAMKLDLQREKEELKHRNEKILHVEKQEDSPASQPHLSLDTEIEESSSQDVSVKPRIEREAMLTDFKKLSKEIFGDYEPKAEGLAIGAGEYEERKKRLAAERRADYNAFLEDQEKKLITKKQIVEESVRSFSPRTVLESDYRKLLLKKKVEEKIYRDVNSIHSIDAPDLTLEDKKYGNKSEASAIISGLEESSSASSLEPVDYRLSRQDINSMVPNRGNYAPETDNNVKFWNNRTGGGGEPVKDALGRLITNRRTIPDKSSSVFQRFENESSSLILPSAMKQDAHNDVTALYREELQRQIEEKKRLAALEKEAARQLEEKIAYRINEQRLRMQREYEEDLQKQNKLKEEFQRQQQRSQMLQEFKEKDEELRRKKFRESRSSVERREQLENEKNLRMARSPSPPVPAVTSKIVVEKSVKSSSIGSNEDISSIDSRNLLSHLSEIRQMVLRDQKKLEHQMESYKIMNRRTVQEESDSDDEYGEPLAYNHDVSERNGNSPSYSKRV